MGGFWGFGRVINVGIFGGGLMVDKWEEYAVSFYLSQWPINCTFTDLMQWLRLDNEDTDQEICVWEMLEDAPLPDIANMIERMVDSLRRTF